MEDRTGRPALEGLGAVGERIQFDGTVRILNPAMVRIGSDVRIDSGVFISAQHPVTIGSFVHLAVGVKIFASGAAVTLGDFVGLSSDVKIFTSTDDYTTGALTNPMVPDDLRDVHSAEVSLEDHVVVGAGSVLLPGSRLGYGVAVGALTVVRGRIEAGAVIAGSPPRRVGRRDTARLSAQAEMVRAMQRQSDVS